MSVVTKRDELIDLRYSTPDCSKHFQFLCDDEEVGKNNTKKHPGMKEEKLTHDYTAKGYNAIFYRTVQYLRIAFEANIKKHWEKRLPDQFNSERDNFYPDAEKGHSRSKENTNAAHQVGHGLREEPNDQDKNGEIFNRSRDFWTHGIHNADLKFIQGELVAVVGKRRAGKTSLLQFLSGRLVCGCEEVRRL